MVGGRGGRAVGNETPLIFTTYFRSDLAEYEKDEGTAVGKEGWQEGWERVCRRRRTEGGTGHCLAA